MMLILASGSPRRREILTMLGYSYEVCPANTDETLELDIPPDVAVAVLAKRKALAVAAQRPGDTVLGSDTLVYCGGTVLGKPAGPEEAKAMLRLLSGKIHQVYTGVAVVQGNREEVQVTISDVKFLPLTEQEIERYVATGEPLDKAGAYAVQGRGSALIESICGDFFAIMGLPSASVVRTLRAFGVEPDESLF
ncbi:MAG: septum formation protein Maf [Clostridiales bacterium]|nr:MAG: septum formation protein Maf [Clostridiales bacterium]